MKCGHMNRLKAVTPDADGCSECIKRGDKWVHLRICLECGHVGCCNSSINKHATRHYNETGHTLMQSFEKDEMWGWCYEEGILLKFDKKIYQE